MQKPSDSEIRTAPDSGVPAGGVSRAAMSMPKVAFASYIGAMLEWYDFFLFGTASALIFRTAVLPPPITS